MISMTAAMKKELQSGSADRVNAVTAKNSVRAGLSVTATAVTISARERRIIMDDKKVTLPDGTVVDEATIKNLEGNREEGK